MKIKIISKSYLNIYHVADACITFFNLTSWDTNILRETFFYPHFAEKLTEALRILCVKFTDSKWQSLGFEDLATSREPVL